MELVVDKIEVQRVIQVEIDLPVIQAIELEADI
jgi:hypothetical protein